MSFNLFFFNIILKIFQLLSSHTNLKKENLCAEHIQYIYISSSSYRAGSTDIPDPLEPLLPIIHRPR